MSVEHITGESIPVLKRSGDALPAGALCHDGALCVRTSSTSNDSTPARIARLAKEAQAKRPKLRTWLDIFGEVYSKSVIIAASTAFILMVALGVPILGNGSVKGALYRSMGLLTVASPCALVMVPMAYVSAIAALAARGILLKGGRVLDAVRKCRVIAMDKTGTITTGTLAVRSIDTVEEISNSAHYRREDTFSVAKALSIRSSHPVSDAVISEANKIGTSGVDLKVENFSLVPGGGVAGIVTLENGTEVSARFGSLSFASEILSEEELKEINKHIDSKEMTSGALSVIVMEDVSKAIPGKSITLVLCEDTLRGASHDAVQALQSGTWYRSGPKNSDACRVVMLTGDNEASAKKVAQSVGIQDIHFGLSPEQKLDLVRSLGGRKSNKSCVLMIGDGLNDAAALSAARVGVAIASPAIDAASLASDVVVMRSTSGIASVPLLLQVATATHRIIVQNMFLAAGSIIVLSLPTLLGFLPLWLAVMFHEGSTLLVALNSLRLLRFS